MDLLASEGIGLDYDDLRLAQSTEGWLLAGTTLCSEVADFLGPEAEGVEQIGSSSVVGMLAKPILDLAVGLDSQHNVDSVRGLLEDEGWIYRGDAGNDGGHVFVLETRPWHRVAHLHVVEHGGSQWIDYLRLRNLLRRSPEARERYGATKRQLLESVNADRKAYTDGKSDVIRSLLEELGDH